MTEVIDKRTALKALCVARQAERSVDFGLHSERQWALLREYYDAVRLQPVLETVAQLEARTEMPSRPISRYEAFQYTVGRVVAIPICWFANHFRRRWRFRKLELQFLLLVLRTFL